MRKAKTKPTQITFRVTEETRRAFYKAVVKYGEPSDVLRQMVEALIEGRLRMEPPAIKESPLYAPRIQD